MLTLAEAAQRVGLHRSNLLRAIKAGRISATRDESGAYQVDEAELVRVYPEGPHRVAVADGVTTCVVRCVVRQVANQVANSGADRCGLNCGLRCKRDLAKAPFASPRVAD